MCFWLFIVYKNTCFLIYELFILLQNCVIKWHNWQFWMCDELKVGISEVRNGVKVTEDLREGYGWVRGEALRITHGLF